ncbi:hypothetical protein Dthio_PD0223 [Desulfonatronospira thiodismutans ASO3-1]|uniref:Uncharacterized protein n=1 Tax=Desulfonatronospira thiodismutans ASO3-1 TaxID=555779 RepID=D6SUC9_9BACT|nr:hypothetical protein Dthio_PD0223 [Desulfonatronospira thiodismutans ASO3-1]
MWHGTDSHSIFLIIISQKYNKAAAVTAIFFNCKWLDCCKMLTSEGVLKLNAGMFIKLYIFIIYLEHQVFKKIQ